MSLINEHFIFETLITAGTCKRCALRYMPETCVDYEDPDVYIKKFSLQNNGTNTNKKHKMNPCIVCLGVLQDSTLDEMITCDDLNKISKYDCDTFVNYISLPTSVIIREHSMEIYMREVFQDVFKDQHITPINKAWTLAIQNKLGKAINKKYNKNGCLLIQFTTSHDSEQEESSVMYKLEEKFKKLGTNKILSRNLIVESLKSIDKLIFRKYYPIPPELPNSNLKLSGVSFQHEPIFIAGRYCKYSRALGQSPWIVDNVKIAENSVQEIIFDAIGDTFNSSMLVFSSSGREDFDVRMLGRGRPFFIKICDPKITKLAFKQFREIENKVNKTKLVSVRDLQFIDKNALSNIKDGEQTKRKTYRALCIVPETDDLSDYIKKINAQGSVVLEQKTPIRVFHRRSCGIRKREIYKISAKLINDKKNVFQLDMETQAGTYVKEFVHGDLGRTRPSLKDIIGVDVDILTLDVLEIHLDFPPPLDYQQKQ